MTGAPDEGPRPEDVVPRWLWRLSRVVVVAFVVGVAGLVVLAVVLFAVR